MELSINYLAVLIAAVASFAFGALWHSPLGFGAHWQKLMEFTPESFKKMPLTPVQAMLIGFIVTVLFSYVLGYFVVLANAATFAAALSVGFWVWLGFVATTLAGGWLWEGKSIKLFLFNAAYQLISIEIMAAVLGLWR
ncbi:MAG: DUF1761 domain-containing protein [Patescibacteria group bacterium]